MEARLISLDCETTGVDIHHGARPFIVTSCDEANNVTFWECPVNPFSRKPMWDKGELEEIQELVDTADGIVFQNPKFDIQALEKIGVIIPWDNVKDTLLASHILASNQPHDLTSLAMIYLGCNIKPLEDDMEACVKEARKIAKASYPEWKIAVAGDPTMPSATEKVWKYDMWLPRAVAQDRGFDQDHPWRTCTTDYANGDSVVTIALYKVLLRKMEERGLLKIYEARLKLLPVIHKIESHGVSISYQRTTELEDRLKQESLAAHTKCLDLANDDKENPVIEKLPVNGVSNALKEVVFGKFGLTSAKKTDKGNPSMDKYVIDEWLVTLPPDGVPHQFISNLRAYRKRQTAIGYITSYKDFWLPASNGGFVLYPSLNPTGTFTLRFSCYNPNAQQISKQEDANLRYCFGPASGREWWSLDAKNIELRLPAYESGEAEMIALFERPDEPPYFGSTHLLNFHTVYPDLWDKAVREVSFEKAGSHCKKIYASTWYQWCKNGGFAIQYGAMNLTGDDEMGTADRAFHKKGAHSLLESRFSNLQALNAKWINFANEHGYVETIPDRSVDPHRGYPLLCTRSAWHSILETVPLSYHVQGSAMWWMCRGMARSQEYLDYLNEEAGFNNYFIVMQVHDELVFDFPAGRGLQPWKTNLPKIRQVQKLMEEGGKDFGIPTPVGIEFHKDNWASGLTL